MHWWAGKPVWMAMRAPNRPISSQNRRSVSLSSSTTIINFNDKEDAYGDWDAGGVILTDDGDESDGAIMQTLPKDYLKYTYWKSRKQNEYVHVGSIFIV